MSKPWQTPQWKKKRAEFLKDKACEWCGFDKYLVIHHIRHFHGLKEYRKTVTEFMHNYFASRKNESEKERLLVMASENTKTKYSHLCPDCGCSVYSRKTIVPKYKCPKCGITTDLPIKKENASAKYERRRNFRKLFFKRHRKEIDKMFAMRKQQSDKDYLNFKDVEVLCKRCHFAKEKGLVLCEICGKGYHKPKYGKCWNCFQKTDGGKAYIDKNKPRPYRN